MRVKLSFLFFSKTRRSKNCSEISGGILCVAGRPCRRCTRCRVRHASRITSWVGCRTTGSVTMSNESRAIARVSTSGMPWTIWNLEDHRRRTACAPSKFVNYFLRLFARLFLDRSRADLLKFLLSRIAEFKGETETLQSAGESRVSNVFRFVRKNQIRKGGKGQKSTQD